jgi:hypothetical protein
VVGLVHVGAGLSSGDGISAAGCVSSAGGCTRVPLMFGRLASSSAAGA